MNFLRKLLRSLTHNEIKSLFGALILLALAIAVRSGIAINENSVFVAMEGGIFREGSIGQPVIINPAISGNQTDLDISALVFAPIKDIAEHVSADEKNKVFTISLKENLLWDDDMPLTSDDVIFTINTIRNPESRSPLFSDWENAEAERVSQLQVRITIPSEDVSFISSIKNLRVIPEHIYGNIPPENTRLSEFVLEPVGSGPYSFKKFLQKRNGFITEYILDVNENYSGKKPYVSEFHFIFYENAESLQKAFRLREIDGFGTSLPFDSSAFKSLKARVSRIPTAKYVGVFFNMNTPALHDKNLRNAMIESVSASSVVNETIPFAEALITSGPTLQNDESVFDPDNALNTVAKMESVPLFKLVVPKIDHLEKTSDAVIKAWNKIGITNIEVVNADTQTLKNILKTGGYDAIIFEIAPKNTDDFFPFWHSSERGYPGKNISFYKNTKVDALIGMLKEESGAENRKEIGQLIEMYINQDSTALFLYSLPYTYIVKSDMDGIPFFSEYWKERLLNPSERFNGISEWFVTKARILK